MSSLTEPLDLPCGVRLPTRIAKAALSEALGDSDNSPDERIVTPYRRWAQGGYGLLITGNIMVDRDHLGEPGNIVIEDDRALADSPNGPRQRTTAVRRSSPSSTTRGDSPTCWTVNRVLSEGHGEER